MKRKSGTKIGRIFCIRSKIKAGDKQKLTICGLVKIQNFNRRSKFETRDHADNLISKIFSVVFGSIRFDHVALVQFQVV